MATLGGALVLGRDDIGALTPGMAADFVAFDLARIGLAGAVDDPLAALVFCAPGPVSHAVVNGRPVVEDGRLTTIDLRATLARHNEIARALANGDPF